ncbi:recombination protein NinB [Sinorhizobium meliloti]|uniref:recombination protein NinB n=1 Tax=Rhizobium meliloti TaxID=382 RepID=UPI000B4A2630|nr:recombination protein NinB [Sinorhizobium meliloti]ASP90761.1 recombinase [Sinorhizobium meliloti]MDW9578886.1 recombinase [Sinorhizobium meliloti]MQX60136.1 recombinase [Sinorhizobium meliloti]
MSKRNQRFILINDRVRENAIAAIASAEEGSSVSVGPKSRSVDQNAKFHAICTDISKSHMTWAGKRRGPEEWKVLLVSAHTVATKNDPGAPSPEIVPGLEGEFVNIRESTARMSVGRAASLITYALAFCDTNGIHLTETIRGGFLDGANDWRAA